MTFKIHKAGYAAIAGALASPAAGVTSMLIELDAPQDAGCDILLQASDSGAIVPAHGQANGSVVTFTGLVRAQDFGAWVPERKITRATLLKGKEAIATSVIAPPVELSDIAYTSVSVNINFGD